MKDKIKEYGMKCLSSLGRKVYQIVLNSQDHWVGAATIIIVTLMAVLAIA